MAKVSKLDKDLRERIIAYNKRAKETHEKATDMDIIIEAFGKLPPGQLKKVLTDEVIAVLSKYGL